MNTTVAKACSVAVVLNAALRHAAKAAVAIVLLVVAVVVALHVAVAAPIVATVEAVAHAAVAGVVAVPPVAPVIPAAAPVVAPAVTAAVDGIEVRPAEIEIAAMRIAGIDAEVPIAGAPVERTVEIGGFNKSPILPVEQNVAQVEVAVFPVDSVEVGLRVHTNQIVEVDFVCSLVLLFGEIQFIRHLVGEEQGLLTSLFVAHGVGICHGKGEQSGEGDD